jgi:signal transduction histidine kinase
MDPKSPRPERTQTDKSLAVERARTDHALGEKNAAIEEKADVVIERAREEADEVLTVARAKADEKLSQPVSPEQSRATVAQERAREDAVLEDERAKADATLRRERAASARILARLLPLERDKTDQYLLTERARSDNALSNRDDFLGMVSHDLRDLLNVIVVNAATIAEHTTKDSPGESTLMGTQRIQRAAGRMGRLIGDLVDIASIDAGKLAIAPAVSDASSVVAEALEIWAPPALAKGIELGSIAHGPLAAKFDNERVLQVLGNLITNAVKFSARGGKVLVEVAEVGGEARFSVKDDGVGIPEDKLEAVFERFCQVGPNVHNGLGLGLYISKCLVQAHGGRIWAESTLGAGSTFFFTVPGGGRQTHPPSVKHGILS